MTQSNTNQLTRDKALQYVDARNIEFYINKHGFDTFLNSDYSISFELPYTYQVNGKTLLAANLVTVNTKTEARAALGY